MTKRVAVVFCLIESKRVLIFGDCIEGSCLVFDWGQTVTIRASEQKLKLVVA